MFVQKLFSSRFQSLALGACLALAVSPAQAQSVTAAATCKLTNTAVSKTLYEGICKVKQSQSGANTIFSITM